MTAAFDAWVHRTRSTPLEHLASRRRWQLKAEGQERVGPCPKCGGTDRFAINAAKQAWNCRGCGKRCHRPRSAC
jgi:hypothetical protein